MVSLPALPKPRLGPPSHAGTGAEKADVSNHSFALLQVMGLGALVRTVGISAAQADGVVVDGRGPDPGWQEWRLSDR